MPVIALRAAWIERRPITSRFAIGRLVTGASLDPWAGRKAGITGVAGCSVRLRCFVPPCNFPFPSGTGALRHPEAD